MNREDKVEGPNIRKEKETVEKMIHIYCDGKHSATHGVLCADCKGLLVYSHTRLDHCRFGEDKPTCRKCPVHCYSPSKREKIRRVMRYSGPRLLFRRPIEWIRHKWHDRKSD